MKNILSKKSTRNTPNNSRPKTFSQFPSLDDPKGYVTFTDLETAFRLSIALGQPLLLTGEPGVGKTQFAYKAAYQLGHKKLLRMNVKSQTEASDFFYSIDEVRRFRDAQLGINYNKNESRNSQASTDNSLDIINYFSYGPLGEAIVRASRPGTYSILPPIENHSTREQSIILIDEIDKAPRDVANDLLNELENMEFEIPEINLKITAEKAYKPVVIITSNSEKTLPDPFLRRCIYFHIPFPGDIEGEQRKNMLEEIIYNRVKIENEFWLSEAINLFGQLREERFSLQKKPGLFEMLNWIQVLNSEVKSKNAKSIKDLGSFVVDTLPILIKTNSDLIVSREFVRESMKL